MIRCKPLLGTYVEISADDDLTELTETKINLAIDFAFSAIELVHQLMGFHDPMSDLSKINQRAHIEMIQVHPWTYTVLAAAIEIHNISNGIFDCGVGAKLISLGLLPSHRLSQAQIYGGLADVVLQEPDRVRSSKPVQLDLGGIAKGFAVDKAVEALQIHGVRSGSINAGGDMRVFGSTPKEIHVRSPSNPIQLISIGSLVNGSIASTGTYYQHQGSPIIHPMHQKQIQFKGSFSVLADECIYADALTKVLAISPDESHPYFTYFSAKPLRIAA